MNVREAIQALQKLDPELRLYALAGDEDWHEVERFPIEEDRVIANDAGGFGRMTVMTVAKCQPW